LIESDSSRNLASGKPGPFARPFVFSDLPLASHSQPAIQIWSTSFYQPILILQEGALRWISTCSHNFGPAVGKGEVPNCSHGQHDERSTTFPEFRSRVWVAWRSLSSQIRSVCRRQRILKTQTPGLFWRYLINNNQETPRSVFHDTTFSSRNLRLSYSTVQ